MKKDNNKEKKWYEKDYFIPIVLFFFIIILILFYFLFEYLYHHYYLKPIERQTILNNKTAAKNESDNKNLRRILRSQYDLLEKNGIKPSKSLNDFMKSLSL